MPEFKTKGEYEKWKAEKAKKSQESLKAKENQQAASSGVAAESGATGNPQNSDNCTPIAKKNTKIYIAVVLALIMAAGGYFLYVSYVKLDMKKFDGVYKAAKKIQASTSLGVNYMQFGEILNNLGTEIFILKDKTQHKGKSFLTLRESTRPL